MSDRAVPKRVPVVGKLLSLIRHYYRIGRSTAPASVRIGVLQDTVGGAFDNPVTNPPAVRHFRRTYRAGAVL